MYCNRLVRRSGGVVLLLALAGSADATDSYTFTPNLSAIPFLWGVSLNSGASQNNPTLHLMRGSTYEFTVQANQFHPFYVMLVRGTNTLNAYGGYSGNGAASSTSQATQFTVPADAPDVLYYDCSIHSSMSGEIDISVFRDTFE